MFTGNLRDETKKNKTIVLTIRDILIVFTIFAPLTCRSSFR